MAYEQPMTSAPPDSHMGGSPTAGVTASPQQLTSETDSSLERTPSQTTGPQPKFAAGDDTPGTHHHVRDLTTSLAQVLKYYPDLRTDSQSPRDH